MLKVPYDKGFGQTARQISILGRVEPNFLYFLFSKHIKGDASAINNYLEGREIT